MQIRFLGATGRVTGSCYWLRDPETQSEFLIDCGLIVGEGDGGEWNRGTFPFNPAKIAFVVLTHAHLDHCGLIPLLYKRGFKGTVFTTRETAALARINLQDAAKLGEVPFGSSDVARVRFHEPVGKGLFVGFHRGGEDLLLHFLRSSHLMGAISVEVAWGTPPWLQGGRPWKRILFSGDLGVNQPETDCQPLLRAAMREHSDYVVVESTYGGRPRPAEERDYEARLRHLDEAVRASAWRGGTLLIPVFAIGRYQDVLFDLYLLAARDPEGIGRVPILTAAPMGDRASSVYLAGLTRTGVMPNGDVKPVWRNRELMTRLGLKDGDPDDEAILANMLAEMLGQPEGFSRDPRRDMHPSFIVRNWGLRHQSWRPRPDDGAPDLVGKIFVASGGMCDGGMITKVLPELLPKATTTVFFTGYQSGGTNGARLLTLKGMANPERRRVTDALRWKGPNGEVQTLPLAIVEAEIRVGIGYSGHADQAGLLDWLFFQHKGQQQQAGGTIFVTHGDNGQRRALQAAIERKATDVGHQDAPAVILPTPRDGWFDLDLGDWSPEAEEDEIAHLEAKLNELKKARRHIVRLGTVTSPVPLNLRLELPLETTRV